MSGDDYISPARGAGFWIGHPGALYHVHGVVSPYGIEEESEPVLTKSLGGGVRARTPRARAHRAWKVDIPDVFPQDVANLRTLLTATMGPYVFVDPWAQKTNLLTPEESVLSSVAAPAEGLAYGGGGWRLVGLPDQWVPVTRSNPSAGVVRVGHAPVPPAWASRTVTASCWLAGTDAQVRMDWLDGSGNRITPSAFGSQVSGMDGLRRSVASGMPPWGCESVQITALNAEVLAQAAVTWTDAPTPWDVGNGVQRVIISGLSRSISRASDAYRMHDLSFTVTEVGPAQVAS